MVEFPVIDLEKLLARVDDDEARLMAACSRTGFFYVTNHGIPQEEIDAMFSLSKKTFDLPLEVKEKYPIDNNVGYTRMGQERLASMDLIDYKEGFNFPSSLNLAKPEQLPPTISENYKATEEFARTCQKVGHGIFRGLANGLGLDQEYFVKAHTYGKPSGGILRFLRYPAVPSTVDSTTTIRAGAHSDYGSITLLFQESGDTEEVASGLQVCIQDSWYDVPAKRGCIVVNIADLLSFWSEGRLRSAVHRVILPECESNKARHSLVFFMHPDGEHIISPTPSPLPPPFPAEKDNEGRSIASFGPSPFTYHQTGKEYLWRRLNLTYDFAAY